MTDPVSPPSYPAEWECDVLAADGGVVHLRPLRPDDVDELERFFAALTDETIYYRFFTRRRPLRADIERLAEVDYDRVFALVAEVGSDMVGVGRYTGTTERPDRAEVAFTISEAHQHRGLGTILLEHLAAIARDRGIRRFHAETLGDNRAMLRVFSHAGLPVTRELDQGVWEVDLELGSAPDATVVERFEHTADSRSVQRFLSPRAVAVVTGDTAPGAIGHTIVKNMVEGGYQGAIHLVTPDGGPVAGVAVTGDLAGATPPPDVGVIATAPEEVADAVAACADAGAAAVVVVSPGFAESGAVGAAATVRLREEARRRGVRLVGPASMGVLNTSADVRLNATVAPVTPGPGRVGFLSQSGALGVAVLAAARDRGVGLSSFVSVGNKADVSGNDLLQYWEDDPATDVIALYLESFGNPRKFARLARRISRTKPIVAVKGGRSVAVRRSATAVSGSDPGHEDRLVDALFDHTGVIRVDTLERLFDVVRLVVAQPLPAGRRVAVVGNSGGPGVLAADAAEAAGLRVDELAPSTHRALRRLSASGGSVVNPVDLVAGSTAGDYEAVLAVVLADDEVDGVVVTHADPSCPDPDGVALAVARAAAAGDKPVVATLPFARRGHAVPVPGHPGRAIPLYTFPEAAAGALASAAHLGTWRRRPEGATPALPDLDVDRARAVVSDALATQGQDGTPLPPAATAALLEAIGLPLLDAGGLAPAIVCGVHSDPELGPLVSLASAARPRDAAFRMAPVSDLAAAELVHEQLGVLHTALRQRIEDVVLRSGVLADTLPEVAELEMHLAVDDAGALRLGDARARLAMPTRPPAWVPRRLG